jgi:hypothetical protein
MVYFLIISSADMGGLLGLFMGCSLISIVELLYFGLAALLERKKRDEKPASKPKTRVIAVQ